jgi:transcriptional regulator with XRE-family HTH domain
MRLARKMANLSQERLGELVGLDRYNGKARISRYEGDVHEPPFPLMEKIAAVLRLPVIYFYCADEALAQLVLLVSRHPEIAWEDVLAKTEELLRKNRRARTSSRRSSPGQSPARLERRHGIDRRSSPQASNTCYGHPDRRSHIERRHITPQSDIGQRGDANETS